MKYCPKCGEVLTNKDINNEGIVPYCDYCNELYFTSPKPVILIAIFNHLNQVALIYNKRKQFWGLVAGYVKVDETIEEAAIREAYEETGLNVDSLNYYYDCIDRFKNIVFCFKGNTNDLMFNIIDEDEVAEVRWCDFEMAVNLIGRKCIGLSLIEDIYRGFNDGSIN